MYWLSGALMLQGREKRIGGILPETIPLAAFSAQDTFPNGKCVVIPDSAEGPVARLFRVAEKARGIENPEASPS